MRRPPNPYLGSVRFFKHVIVLTISLMIAIPTGLCILFWTQNLSLRASASEVAPPPSAVTPMDGARLNDTDDTDVPPSPTLSAELPPWETLYPDLYAPPAQRSTVNEEKTVYLTFDDGPSALTPRVLEILDRYGVKATFFVVGQTDEQSLQWMRDIVAAGHTLGMHSFSHDYNEIYTSVESFLSDYKRIYELIYEATGAYPQISRFPGGSINGYNGSVYRDLIAELVRRGFVYFDWNASNDDATRSSPIPATTLAENALSRADSLRRAVVLMHDSGAKHTTVEALPAIIEGYQAAGFTFAALTPEVVPVVYTYPD